jgi:hypothetical protein
LTVVKKDDNKVLERMVEKIKMRKDGKKGVSEKV